MVRYRGSKQVKPRVQEVREGTMAAGPPVDHHQVWHLSTFTPASHLISEVVADEPVDHLRHTLNTARISKVVTP